MRTVTTVLGFALLAAALPSPSNGGISIPLTTRSWKNLSNEERLAWIQKQDLLLKNKYEKGRPSKRASSSVVPLTDQLGDVAYYGTVDIGTPRKSYGTLISPLVHLTRPRVQPNRSTSSSTRTSSGPHDYRLPLY